MGVGEKSRWDRWGTGEIEMIGLGEHRGKKKTW